MIGIYSGKSTIDSNDWIRDDDFHIAIVCPNDSYVAKK